MSHFGRCLHEWAAIAFLCCASVPLAASTNTTHAPPSTSSVLPTTSRPSIATCEARTINYITNSLPQVCLRYPRADSTRAALAPSNAAITDTTDTTTKAASGTAGHPVEEPASSHAGTSPNIDGDSALDESSFLSFEDWKKQTLEREGAIDASSDRRSQVFKDRERRRNPEGIQDALKALEEDVVIDADFTAFLADSHDNSASKGPEDDAKANTAMLQTTGDDKGAGEKPRLRSKDAGKTCKERSNFASLDAGGQVMNTNAEATSASALLKEDRDVYMLNICQAKNKFLIVELSESILVETVAIANFEFFSSTFRHFRLSVSDRYPVKLDRWIDLGTFEARNSRDIQAFLVEDPRIWARYLRLELLSHYGNEFYCPISLLRVHGRTMMEDATRSEEEIEDDLEGPSDGADEIPASESIIGAIEEEKRVLDGLREAELGIEELVKGVGAISSSHVEEALETSQIIEAKVLLENASMAQMTTPWTKPDPTIATLMHVLYLSKICLPSEAPSTYAVNLRGGPNQTSIPNEDCQSNTTCEPPINPGKSSAPSGYLLPDHEETENRSIAGENASILISKQEVFRTELSTNGSLTSQDPITSAGTPIETSAGHSKHFNKTSPTTSSYVSQPTTQESFFKTVTKRLQLLEANSTLSLKYIEEQSRILRDAFTKVEKRQLAKTTSFLENLNDTVLEELRKFSQQYDQIWQSTVVELETQRDQSQREIAAVSTRLSILAEELVFQKRMSIVQSILLLLCLCLVIFSRGSGAGYIDMPMIQNIITRSYSTSGPRIENTSNRHRAQRMQPASDGRPWFGYGHRRQRSDDSAASLRSRSRDASPPTPFSAYSGQEEDLKQDTCNDNLLREVRTGPAPLEPEAPGDVGGQNTFKWQDSEATPENGLSFDKYPNFGNSTLWLAQDPSMLGTDRVPYVEHRQLDNAASEVPSNTNQRFERRHTKETTDRLSALPEDEKREFSIARKPLPALPSEA